MKNLTPETKIEVNHKLYCRMDTKLLAAKRFFRKYHIMSRSQRPDWMRIAGEASWHMAAFLADQLQD